MAKKKEKYGWRWGGRAPGRSGRYVVGSKQPKMPFDVVSTHRTSKAARAAMVRQARAHRDMWARTGRGPAGGYKFQVRDQKTGRRVAEEVVIWPASKRKSKTRPGPKSLMGRFRF